MKLWVDDIRTPPESFIPSWVWCRSVEEAKAAISVLELHATVHPSNRIELIDIDHDAGDYAADGGDYIKLLDWFEETGRNYPIRIHSMNVVGRMNMEAICRRNGWTIVE